MFAFKCIFIILVGFLWAFSIGCIIAGTEQKNSFKQGLGYLSNFMCLFWVALFMLFQCSKTPELLPHEQRIKEMMDKNDKHKCEIVVETYYKKNESEPPVDDKGQNYWLRGEGVREARDIQEGLHKAGTFGGKAQ